MVENTNDGEDPVGWWVRVIAAQAAAAARAGRIYAVRLTDPDEALAAVAKRSGLPGQELRIVAPMRPTTIETLALAPGEMWEA